MQVKPQEWVFDINRIAPEWRPAYRNPQFVWPLWEKGDDVFEFASDKRSSPLLGNVQWSTMAASGQMPGEPCLNFIGAAADFVNIGDIIPFRLYEVTIVCYYEFATINNNDIMISGNLSGTNNGDWHIALTNNSGGNRDMTLIYQGGSRQTSGRPFTTGTKKLVHFRLNSEGASIFLDGVPHISNTTPGYIGGNGANCRVGLHPTGGSNNLDAKIGFFHIDGSAWTDEFIYQHAQDLMGPYRRWGGTPVVGSVAASAALSGTVEPSLTEAEAVAGGETVVLTLTNDTFV